MEEISLCAGFRRAPLCKLETQKSIYAYVSNGVFPSRGVVGINKKMIDILERKELEAVIAHEVAHLREKNWVLALISALDMFFFSFLVYTIFIFIVDLFWSFFGFPGGGMFLSSVYSWVGIIAYMGNRMLVLSMRQREFCADAYGVIWLKEIDAFQKALIKTSCLSLRGNEHKFFRYAFSQDSHPEIEERLALLEKLKRREK